MPTQQLTRPRGRRTERMVVLRSAMPVQLVTLRHERPRHLLHHLPVVLPNETITTSKVREQDSAETSTKKGGDAR